MKPKEFIQIKLGKGEVYVYDFGEIKMHAYKSNDSLDDVSFMLEKDGFGMVLEPQSFTKNIREFEEYLKETEVLILGLVVAYHMSGGTFLKDVKRYGSAQTKFDGATHSGKKMVSWLSRLFGNDFDDTPNNIDYHINDGQKITIGGVRMTVLKTIEGLDLIFPEIKTIYTHVFGARTHAILYGIEHVEENIENWRRLMGKRLSFVISSHGLPDDAQDIRKRISYLKTLRRTALRSHSAKEFKQAMEKRYPDFDGLQYLDITAGFLFKK